MIGITSFGAHIPFLRLNRSAMGGKGEKALANFDEDSITMAVAAVMDCLKGVDRTSVDGLYFASTTSPYQEKQSASTVAMATDLRRDIITADFANTLKAGTNAIRSAADAVAAGTAGQVVVAAADTRLGLPGSVFEQSFGDGAAALVVGTDDIVAEIEASHSVCNEIMDVWRIDGSRFVKSWEARFVSVEGYHKPMEEAVSGILKKAGLQPQDFARVVFYTPDQRSSAQLAKKIGFDPKTQLFDPLFGLTGDTGTPYAIMLLVAALEQSNPGDRILLAGHGNGADTFVFKVTDKIKDMEPRGGVQKNISSKHVTDDYQAYLYNRKILPGSESLYPFGFGGVSAPAMYREADSKLRLHGAQCENCGTSQYPPQRVCIKCNTKDRFQPVRFSDKKGKVFTFSMDNVSSRIDSPVVIPVVDFEGGGRMECFMTDRVAKEVKVGMEVEMTFRKLFERDEFVNYFWKARPVRF